MSSSSKKEIRLKVDSKLYSLLSQNATNYGVKPNDYILYLLLDDIKDSQAKQIPYIGLESEQMIQEGYEEVQERKRKGKLKGLTAAELKRKLL